MTPYFLIYLLSYFNIIQENYLQKKLVLLLVSHFILLILFAGTRNEIGGDWNNYYNFFTSFETKALYYIRFFIFFCQLCFIT